MSTTSKAGIQTDAEGTSYIPASRRSDGTTRREIRVRPGYRPPEDVEKYTNRTADAWKNRGKGGIPGADPDIKPEDNEPKSKNAKRREAARRKAAAEEPDSDLTTATQAMSLKESQAIENWQNPDNLAGNSVSETDDAEKQKKIRNTLKKLNAVRELRAKKMVGEKLSADQLVKLTKEEELVRDLRKLGYEATDSTETHQNGVPNDKG